VNIRKKPTLKELADYLEDNARSDMDNEAAAALRKYSVLSKVAHDMVMANTHDSSKAAYCEMIDLIKGKTE
jgi:ATP/maltotriose-dependent transcriptional regulator MalT